MDVSCRGLDQPHQYHMLGDPNHDSADEENKGATVTRAWKSINREVAFLK